MNPIFRGATVRVVDFTPQYWKIDEDEWDRAERTLLGCYAGKVGTVVHVDQDRAPYLVKFSDSTKVPIKSMRFYPDEVEDIG